MNIIIYCKLYMNIIIYCNSLYMNIIIYCKLYMNIYVVEYCNIMVDHCEFYKSMVI